MAQATYTTDLTDIDDGSGTFTEPTSAVLGTLTNADVDNFVQGTNSSTKSTGASGAPALAGIGILDAGAHTITSPNAFYCWVFVGAGALIDTYANGGIRLLIGNTSANYRYWYVDGNNFFPYIGWQCIAIETDNAVVAADGSVGTPTATKQYFGAIFNCLINIGKGNPMAVDALRWGRTITILNGDLANGYATFAGCATTNDAIGARWGQFQAISGGYQLQGKLLLGTTGSTIVDFRDSNKSIAIAVSRKTATSFNAIEIQNASSRVDWDSCVFTALGTNSRGTITVTDNADVNISSCSFTGMDTFSFLAATDVLDSTFRGCNAITAAGSNMTGTQVLVPTITADTSALIWNVATNTDGKLNSMTFSKGTYAHHAITLGASSLATLTLRGITFTGFNGSDAQNDSVLLLADKGSNTAWTISAVGCSGTVSYKKVRAGDTVSIVVDPVTVLVNVKNTSGTNIQDARVILKASDALGPFPFEESVTISNSGSTATVTHTGHGMATNDKVVISGASLEANNGVYAITYIDVNSYSYTMGSSPGSSPTGTIISTFVALSGLTDASGNISMTRVFSADQNVVGWVRKTSTPPNYTPPNYKTGPIAGSIDSAAGFTANVQLISDD
jgi:hypothetical protein